MESEAFFYETKALVSFILISRMSLRYRIMKRNKIIIRICVYPTWKMNFDSKNGRKKSFSYETKALVLLSQWGQWVYGAQSGKERWLLCESMFILIYK